MDNMLEKNKEKQSSIYSKMFTADNIDYDDFLLPPYDFVKEKYLARLHPNPGNRALEIGIGISSFLGRAVLHHKIVAFGLDYVETSLFAQKRNCPYNLRLCKGDGEALPYNNDSFDLVIIISVVEHLSDYNQAFREIRRVLKPGGKCLFHLPCKDFRFSLLARFKTYDDLNSQEWFIQNQKDTGHDFKRIPDRKGWKQLAVDNRFSVMFIDSSDILFDSWMMYYFFRYIKTAQAALIRYKRKCKDFITLFLKDCKNTHPEYPKLNSDSRKKDKKYSFKRKIIGFLWFHGILRIFWILTKLERIFNKLPVGACIYMGVQKKM